jgi:hypothetical protein
MKVTPSHFLIPLLPLGAGALLGYAGYGLGWGAVWVAGGGYFITVAVAAWLLTLAWVAPDPIGAFLRHPIVNIVILLAVLGMLVYTVVLGAIGLMS